MALLPHALAGNYSSCSIQLAPTYSTSTKKFQLPGLVGELHSPVECHSNNIVVVLGGSEGGVPGDWADSLAKKGITAFALGYFGHEGLPPALASIPLDYFQNAISEISKLVPNSNCCVLAGASKGAEGALAYASIVQTHLLGLLLFAPSDRAFGGMDEKSMPTYGPAWTYRGVAIALTQYVKFERDDDPLLDKMFPQGRDKRPVCKPFYEATMALPTGGNGIYAVENVRSSILMFAGQDDHMWPSSQMAANLIARAKAAAGFPYQIEAHTYPNVGHLAGSGADILAQDPYNQVWLGGTVEGERAAEPDVNKNTMDYLRKAFNSP